MGIHICTIERGLDNIKSWSKFNLKYPLRTVVSDSPYAKVYFCEVAGY